MKTINLELSDGSKVNVSERWNACNSFKDSGTVIAVTDEEDNLLVEFNGSIPTELYGTSLERFTEKVEAELSWAVFA